MTTAAEFDAAVARRWFLGTLMATLVFRVWLSAVTPLTGLA